MSTIEAVGIQLADPLRRDLPLAHTAMFYPVGFPLRLATNSRDVMEAAAESWDQWSPEFATDPVAMRVLVEPEGDLATPLRFRMQGHLIHGVGDRHNFGVADTQALFASICVSAKTAADHDALRWFFTESMGYMLLTQRYLTGVHAACIARNEPASFCAAIRTWARARWPSRAPGPASLCLDDCTWLLTGSTDRVALATAASDPLSRRCGTPFPELEGWIGAGAATAKYPSARCRPSAFPQITTAKRCKIGRIVFLHRDPAATPRVEPRAAHRRTPAADVRHA
jgi:hypothetical protein